MTTCAKECMALLLCSVVCEVENGWYKGPIKHANWNTERNKEIKWTFTKASKDTLMAAF